MKFTYLITGSAGFIGSALVLRLLERGEKVVGIDNHNAYYDQALKEVVWLVIANSETIRICALT